MPTFTELIVLTLLIGVILGFFIGFKRMTVLFISMGVLIVLFIVAGFFMGIGIDIYQAMIF